MEQGQCCLGVFNTLKEARAAGKTLRCAGMEQVVFSLVYKPGKGNDAASFARLPKIGAVIHEGPFLQAGMQHTRRERGHCGFTPDKTARQSERCHKTASLSAALTACGVSKSWHGAYERALRRGQVLFVAYGPERQTRWICQRLTRAMNNKPVRNGTMKPVLYLR